MAAVPPAIAILPLTKLLDGDSLLSLYSEALCYLASLILMPGIILAFTSRTGVSLSYILEIALLLILLPAKHRDFSEDIVWTQYRLLTWDSFGHLHSSWIE